MEKLCVYYSIIILINLMPSIPLSIKGILGIVFIIISSVKFDFKNTIITTVILIVLQAYSFAMQFSVDYKSGNAAMLLGTVTYLAIAYFLGGYTEKIRNMNRELKLQVASQNCLMNTIPLPLFFKDLNYKYTGINQAFSELLKIKEQDAIGKNAKSLYDSSIAEVCDQMDHALMNGQDNQVREITVLADDNELKSVIIRKALIKDDAGRPSGIVGAVVDISEQKESEILKSNIAELQQEDKLKTEFFSNISHELRTPLNVIFSAVQLIEMSINDMYDNSSRVKIKRNVKSIRQNCLRLQRLVNNLIDITKIDTQAFDLNLQNLDIVYVVEEITLSVADFISNKGIDLLFDTDVEEKIMAFDEEKMERIILNLLSNAIKFTPEGGMIRVSIIDNNDSIQIQFTDTGTGIPQDKLEEVFKRFYQISPVHTRNQEGSGIGLSLVKSLVEMHHGEILVESALGQGTVFSVYLPSKVLMNEGALQSRTSDKHSRIEKIHLEFSDIYK